MFVPSLQRRPSRPVRALASLSICLRTPAKPKASDATPTELPTVGSAKLPPRWAAVLVAVVLVVAAVLVGNGTPVGVVLEVLGGGGFIATEIVRRLNEGN
jgi:hypothetical protein